MMRVGAEEGKSGTARPPGRLRTKDGVPGRWQIHYFDGDLRLLVHEPPEICLFAAEGDDEAEPWQGPGYEQVQAIASTSL